MAYARTLRGQYFSMDAIIASIIFVLALSLLMSHFFALRAQEESRSSYLLSDAYRISEALAGPGDPVRWYANPLDALTPGFAYNASRYGVLNLTALNEARPLLDPAVDEDAYNRARALMVTPAEFYIEVNTTLEEKVLAPNPSRQLPIIRIGRAPAPALHPQEIVQVRRGVVLPQDDGAGHFYYHYGTLTLTLWTDRSRV